MNSCNWRFPPHAPPPHHRWCADLFVKMFAARLCIEMPTYDYDILWPHPAGAKEHPTLAVLEFFLPGTFSSCSCRRQWQRHWWEFWLPSSDHFKTSSWISTLLASHWGWWSTKTCGYRLLTLTPECIQMHMNIFEDIWTKFYRMLCVLYACITIRIMCVFTHKLPV